MFVLGVDPGLTRCGYGCVEQVGRTPRAVALGVLRTDKDDPLPKRLADLQVGIRALIAELEPA
ncbi:MAG: crossover junction endodeoxyribonuclease RuvC, partial [Acidimicrobiales bacterium]